MPTSSARGAGVDVTYCERWDPYAHVAHLPLTEAEARERFGRQWFSVVVPIATEPGTAPRPDTVAAAPDVVLEIEAGLTTVTAVFFDDDTAGVLATYAYQRHGDTLLLAAGTHYDLPEDGRRGLSAVVRTQQTWIQADGTLDVVVDRRGGEEYEGVVNGSVDPAHYRVPVPEFGAWDLLARFDW